ncbi:MAG: putative baseplate assembly protein [Thermoanaerobaculia bacterium]
MTQLAPDLFERRFSDLMEIGRAKLPSLAPDWTDHNAHDPGITLMELLAWVAEAQLYSLARRPRRDERTAYAALLGFVAGGAQPARGLIWPDHGDPKSPQSTFAQSVVIPDDAVISVVSEDTPAFRPEQKLLWVPGRIRRLESRLAGGRTVDLTSTNGRGGTPFLPFGESAGNRDVLAMTFQCRGDAGLFPPRREEARGAVWPIGVRATEAADGAPAQACHSPLAATLVAGGERIPLPIVSDSTSGLLATGALLLDVSGVAGSPREFTIELRAPNGFPRPPRLLRIEPNVVPIVQGRSVARELHVARSEPQPDFNFDLNVPGLRFAAGEEPVTIEIAEVSGLNAWRRCDHLTDLGPDDRVFELDAGRGRVTFGNGVNGRIPPADAQILVSYAVCDGDKGNVARNRRWRVTGFAGAFGVNLDRIAGGAASPGSIDQRREARSRLREHALVSSEDLAAAAKALPLLDVARAWVLPPHQKAPRTGAVTLVVLRARVDGKEPASIPENQRWLDAVRRRLVTGIPLGTRLLVAAPHYADFFIRAALVADAGRNPRVVKSDVERELSKRLAPVDRRPGVPVTRRDLAAWLRAVGGVKSIAELRLIRPGGKEVEEIAVLRGGLPRLDLSRSSIEVRRSTP